MAIAETKDRERAILDFLEDRTLPAHFCSQASSTLKNSRFARGLDAYPDLCFELHHVYASVASVVLEYQSVNGLRAAEVLELDAAGKVRRVTAHYA
jgi:hypothetical protein